MVLVDTSVWIDFFRNKDHAAVRQFIGICNNHIPFGITGVIYQEILQGAASATDFKRLSDSLQTQLFFHPKDNLATYHEAAKIYFDCRRRGITVRSTIDCLIAQIAIEQRLCLLHHDRDFEVIKQVRPQLNFVGPTN